MSGDQLPLDWDRPGHRPPRARRRDPISSHAAADRAERRGRIRRDAAELLRLVVAEPGRTVNELVGYDDARAYRLRKRQSELEARGLIEARHTREDGYTGELRWWPTAQGELMAREIVEVR